jgi:hypothetical protein
VAQGFTAVRLTTPSENFANQHTATDTFANASVPYTTRVARMNAAVLATLALAPKPPVVANPRPAGAGGAGGGFGGARGDATAGAGTAAAAGASDPTGRGGRASATDTAAASAAGGANPPAGAGRGGRGGRGPGLSRGNGYDAVVRWAMPNPEPDLAGYSILIRDTTAPVWQKEVYVGNVTEYTIPDLSIDDIVIGVRAYDKDGNPSLVSAYEMAPTRLIDANPPAQPRPPATGGGGGQ